MPFALLRLGLWSRHPESNHFPAPGALEKDYDVVNRRPRDLAGAPAFHLLVDSASAEYVWRCVIDAMAEFGGRPAGLSALLELTA